MSKRLLQLASASSRILPKVRQRAVTLVGAATQCHTHAVVSHACSRALCTSSTALQNTHSAHTHSPPHCAAGIRSAEAGNDSLEVTFDDGSSSTFPYCWMRDNCQCPQCFDADALCRKLTLEDWHHDDRPTHVQVEEDSNHVGVRWASGHSSRYEAQWLQRHAFTSYARNSQRAQVALKKELWCKELDIPRLDFETVMREEAALLEFLVKLERVGVAILTSAPRKTKEVTSVINKIGYVKHTHYGTHYPIRSKPSASSLAYTDLKLGMHNDLPYFQYTPGIIFLHCITQFEGEGGENDLADGFEVAEYLRHHHPKEYRILTDTPVYFWDKGVAQVEQETTEYYKVINIPIVVEERLSGAVVRVNNSQLRHSYLDLPPHLVEPWYAALRLFNQTVDQHAIRNKLNSGEMLVMDNTRLLHGRTAYDGALGERHMDQAYLDWDGALSMRRVLQERLGVTLE